MRTPTWMSKAGVLAQTAVVSLLFAGGASFAQDGYVIGSYTAPALVNVNLGSAVAFVGDVDGDGLGDYLAGDPGATVTGQINAGEVSLVSGATGTPIRRHLGTQGHFLGAAVAAAGDVDLDGTPDYIVGAPGTLPGGAAHVWSGATGVLLRTFTGTATFICPFATLCGSFSDRLGAAVAGGRDVDGDGVPDLAVGCPGHTASQSLILLGRVIVYSGATGQQIFAVTGTSHEVLGTAVALIGDVDLDGRSELAVGAPRVSPPPYQTQTPPTGSVHVYRSGTGTLLFTVGGTTPADRFGAAVSAAGDVNADGVPDFVVGAPGQLTGSFPNPLGPGLVSVHSGVSGGVIFSVVGTFIGEHFGASVAAAGDMDGDGFADVVAGAPLAAGGANGPGRAVVLRGPTGLALQSFIPGGAQELAGTAVAGGQDISGDGVPDFLVGAPDTSSAGRVYTLDRQGASLPGYSGLGAVLPLPVIEVISAGDQDLDGTADLALGQTDGSIAIVSPATGSLIRVLAGPVPATSSDRLELLDLGPIDGDAFGEIGVATVTTSYNAAQLTVLSGGTGATLHTLSLNVCGLSLVRLGTPGDVDGDGIPDLALGCRTLPLGPCAMSPGFVELRSGATGAFIRRWNGFAPEDDFGVAVAAAGDVDQDGVGDLLVGAPLTVVGGLRTGAVYVYSGATGASLLTVNGTVQDQRFGIEVQSAGDVNGDGVPDFAARSLIGLVPPWTANVQVHSGADGTQLRVITGMPGDFAFGANLEDAGDVDGDGFVDLAMRSGAPGAPTGAGRVMALSGADGSMIFKRDGMSPNEGFGTYMAPIGDWNGDGLADVAAASNGAGTAFRADVVSFAGLPPGALTSGSACAPFGGPVPALAAFGGAPVAGNSSFGLVVSNAPAGVAGYLVIGGSTTSWAGGPLPIPLGSFGLPGCELRVAPEVILPFVTSNATDQRGAARIPLPIPTVPVLSNIFVAAQAFVNDPVRLALGATTRGFALTLP